MKTSVIRRRVADFLEQYPPFDALAEADLLEAAGSGRVKFHQAGEYVLRQGQEKPQVIWMVQQGRLDVLDETSSQPRLRDLLAEGDLLGLECFLGDGKCLYSVRTASDVILYGLSAELFGTLIQRYPSVRHYLRVHFSLSTLTGNRRTSWLDTEGPPADYLRARTVSVPSGASRDEVLSRMRQAGATVVALVTESARPIGVITAAEVATEPLDSVSLAARPRPAALSSPVTTRAAIRAFLTTRGAAIAVTADGTTDSALHGILTAEELALFSGSNPVGLIAAIRYSRSPAEIRALLKQARRMLLDGFAEPRHFDDCARIGSEVSVALAEACLRHAQAQAELSGFQPPATPVEWFHFGPAARSEAIEPACPTLCAVYADTEHPPAAGRDTYFNCLADAARSWLAECDIPSCEASPVAHKPVSGWKSFYADILRDPVRCGIYTRREMFDLAPLSGQASLVQSIQDDIQTWFAREQVSTVILANDTLSNLPPLTLFRGLVIGLDGVERDSLDIKATGVDPITDAARVFAAAGGRPFPAGTLERLETAAHAFPDGADVFTDAAEAFRIAHYYWSSGDGGPVLTPARLSKFDQRLLKTAFSSIQRLLEFTDSTFVKRT